MDPNFNGFPDRRVDYQTPLAQLNDPPNYLTDGFRVNDRTSLPTSYLYPELEKSFEFNEPSLDLFPFVGNSLFPYESDPNNFSSGSSERREGESFSRSVRLSSDGGGPGVSSGFSPGGDSSSDESDFRETVLNYISQMLMEENLEEKPCMFYDPLGLKDTEKSFYDALGKNYPPSPNQPPLDCESSEDACHGNDSDHAGSVSIGTSNSPDPQWVVDPGEYKPSILPTSFPVSSYQSNFELSSGSQNNLTINSHQLVTELLAQNIFSDSTSILQYKKGLEEASKFLPGVSQLNIDLGSGLLTGVASKVMDTTATVKDRRENSPNGSKGRKNHERGDVDLDLQEGRRNKQAAVYVDEEELSDMFDKVLLYDCGNETSANGGCEKLQSTVQLHGSIAGKARERKQEKRKDSVDLRNLLILCAQAVSTDDRRIAHELLRQIRQHSTTIGDGSQRMAHFFANALEARMVGTGTGSKMYYETLAQSKISAADMLKAYQVHLSSCPFKKLSLFFMIKMVLKVAEKAKSLHIIDFGICYGFLWPMLIQFLSQLPDGPPKLRITGIDHPQPGFRPAEKIDETGRRLAKYCERFKVPFQYQGIASHNWETIRIEDLKLNSSDVLVVHSFYRFKNLLDETVEESSPRDVVLRLIRKMNPNIFVHSVVSGSYHAPFFITRFREALFHFSALYDALDVNLPRESEERMMIEREFLGRQIMNVVACEGVERVERPETYKQWHVRCMRAGFKQLPLDQEIMNKFRCKLTCNYHKDFVLDQDDGWMLQGWKGRIVYGSCCWVPT
ncbi:scarecrow-like protein 14 [Momordica charantia]|uniref:Scarecrow-like protein 14 n=1 Tax=Momordica charantia TaxID=3673 RepID=A0A6J1D510_MOMCH|nr:scarecrow-like protein 14 [Momordica charantia]